MKGGPTIPVSRRLTRASGPSSIPPSKAKQFRHAPLQSDHVIINLGRVGDALQSLPMAYLYWVETRKKSAYMVAKEFSSFLEGVSYVYPEIWHGDWKDAIGAKNHCQKKGYKDIVMAQIYGYGLAPGRTQSSFILESWHQVGRLHDWATAPLVFDRRNLMREALLASALPKGKPIILVAADGQSAPFAHNHEMILGLHRRFMGRAEVVNLANFKTEHFHDFLGLFDRAQCLVTIDTGFGQLACASTIPVAALIAYQPSTWYSSPRRPQHICYIRYNEWRQREEEFYRAIEKVVFPS